MVHLKLTGKWGVKFLVLGLALLLMAGPAAGSRPFSDVPDWAYQSVKKLVDSGYLELYEDGTFQGKNSVDRYTLATVVAKLLVNMGEGVTPAGRDDVSLLRKLSNEFQNELVLLTVKDQELEKRLSKIEEEKLILAEDQTLTASGMKLLSNEAKALRGEISGLQSEVGAIAAQILEEKRRVDALELHLTSVHDTQAQQAKAIDDLNEQLAKEKKTNRLLLVIMGALGVAGIFLPGQ